MQEERSKREMNFLSTAEAAKQVGLGRSQFYKLLEAGRINPDKYTYWQGYAFDPDISEQDLYRAGSGYKGE